MSTAAAEIGPLERKHMRRANYRAVADDSRITRTHWRIATAYGLGRGFDGMDGMLFALIAPLVIREFALTVPEYRTGLQISLLAGIAGHYVCPCLADRYGRRSLHAIGTALFALLTPVVALSPTFAVFVIARALAGFALNGGWSLGSMLVAETWPAHLRGRIIGIDSAAWCFGAALAGAITGIVATSWGWRTAVMVPAVIALLAIYIRATCPESPYWVRTQDRKTRVRAALKSGQPVSEEDRAWFFEVNKVGIRQIFRPD
ncbi:MAG: MFS transporter, partial [Solimonas sp.]